MGATSYAENTLIVRRVSIHAPVWVRLPEDQHPRGESCFNSRTRVGATLQDKEYTQSSTVSIHAPVWVRQLIPSLCGFLGRVSIHAPVWVRLRYQLNLTETRQFQFTHPCGCD